MAKPLKPIVRSGGYYPSAKYTPLVYPGGYTTLNAKNGKPEPLNTFVGKIVRFLAKRSLPMVKLEANFTTIQDLLPTAYQAVEYIEGTGTQYIDLGKKANQNTGFRISYYTNNDVAATNYGCILGARQASGSNEFQLTSYATTDYAGSVRVGQSTYSAQMEKQVKQTVSLKNKVLTAADGTETTYTGVDFSTPSNIALFALNTNGTISQYGSVRIYGFQLYDGNNLIMNLVPCYRVSDSVIGMYDLVSGQFLTNSGTGTFTKGSNATLPSPDVICPISGHTGAEINRTGKNLIDIADSDGTTTTAASSAFATAAQGIKFKENTQYTFSIKTKALDAASSAKTWYARFHHTDGTAVGYVASTINNNTTEAGQTMTVYSVTSGANKTVDYIEFTQGTSYGIAYEEAILAEGSTASDYEAYSGTSATITFPPLRKNLLPYPYTDTTKTVNGLTFTDLGDGKLRVNGTSTARAVFFLISPGINFIKSGNYIVSRGTTAAGIRITLDAYNGNTWVKAIATITGAEQTVAIDYDGYDRIDIFVSVPTDTTLSNAVVAPMIRLASNTDDSYEPYDVSNILYGGKLTVFEDGSGQVDVNVKKDSTTWGGMYNATDYTNTTRKTAPLSPQCPAEIRDSNLKFCNVAPFAYDSDDDVHFYVGTSTMALWLPKGTDSDTEIQFCYPITPFTIPLENAQLPSSLVGENNVWVNFATGEITVMAYGTAIE